jgi:hypothetical protein
VKGYLFSQPLEEIGFAEILPTVIDGEYEVSKILPSSQMLCHPDRLIQYIVDEPPKTPILGDSFGWHVGT